MSNQYVRDTHTDCSALPTLKSSKYSINKQVRLQTVARVPPAASFMLNELTPFDGAQTPASTVNEAYSRPSGG